MTRVDLVDQLRRLQARLATAHEHDYSGSRGAANALDQAIEIVAVHEFNQSTHNPLAKRVAELEKELCDIAAREATDELTDKLRDIASSTDNEFWFDTFVAAAERIEALQSQLAWTPVNKGLPTKPGVYEFLRSTAATVETEEFDGATWKNPLHAWSSDPRTSEPKRLLDYTHYRRIELPKDGETC